MLSKFSFKSSIILIPFLLVYGCKPTQQSAVTINTDTVIIRPPQPEVYHGAYTRLNDLVHTKLEVKFDWAKKYLHGKATITLHPHFYSTGSLVLNARGMDIHEVRLTSFGNAGLPLSYTYDSLKIYIQLDRLYKKDENYTVFIAYTSKPNELPEGGSEAITKDRGLYFVNAEGGEPEKPRQAWTQGESESSSAWFPTIEDPQQKMTQEIYITVDNALTTLSNGLMLSSTNNHDGTRTDYWKQSLPTAPYLTMLAVSDFAIVKDKWRNIEVNYYLDKEYEKYARLIFGLTPEMMEFFSNKLGIVYPWEKYSQVVVYDFVTGAMENTTAVVHGTNMLQDSIEHADENYEDVIAHELFHHWFGNLVTCESWSNVTLNEGFANYGEYLWREHKYGRDDADFLMQKDQNIYIMYSQIDDSQLIRFGYTDKENMYDPISYNKGGRVLHMLRKQVGDEAFFASLKFYLEEHRFGVAEIHDLRLAFEKITGEDLNWFFHQWFLKGGHPVIEINYAWNDSLKTQKVIIEQKQDFNKSPLYKIPLLVDIYHDGTVDRRKVNLENAKEEFNWKFPSKPDLVNVDAEKMLLCERKDKKNNEQLVFQYYHAPLYLDRFEPVNKIATDYKENSAEGKMMEDALSDKFWNVRLQAVKNIGNQFQENLDRLKPKMLELAMHDEKGQVRAFAIKMLNRYLRGDSAVKVVIENGLKDSSYMVNTMSFQILADRDLERGEKMAKQFETTQGSELLIAIAFFYSDHPKEGYNDFFLKGIDRIKGYERYTFIDIYGRYLKKMNFALMETGVAKIVSVAQKTTGFIRKAVLNTLNDLQNDLDSKVSDANRKVEELKNRHATTGEIEAADNEAKQWTKLRDDLNRKIMNLR